MAKGRGASACGSYSSRPRMYRSARMRASVLRKAMGLLVFAGTGWTLLRRRWVTTWPDPAQRAAAEPPAWVGVAGGSGAGAGISR